MTAVRWTIKVSEKTDRSLRSFLGRQGMKKGSLSQFVEEAVQWRVLDQIVQAIKMRNRDIEPEALEAMLDEAIQEVRTQPS